MRDLFKDFWIVSLIVVVTGVGIIKIIIHPHQTNNVATATQPRVVPLPASTTSSVHDTTEVRHPVPSTLVATSSVAHLAPVYPNIASLYSYSARDVIQAVNAERIAHGLVPLVEYAELDADAQGHADYLNQTGVFAHDSAQGSFDTWITIPWQWAGENLAEKFIDVSSMVDAWMNSPEHRANILNPHYQHTGVALAGIYTVQLFTN